MENGARRGVVVAMAVLTAAFVAFAFLTDPSNPYTTAFNDILEIVVAVLAGVACHVAARSSVGARRRGWLFLRLGSLAWAAGQAAWTWYEVVLRQEVPFPSVADVGYLAMPPLFCLGLAQMIRTPASRRSRVRALIDALSITGAVLYISWMVVLQRVVAGAGGRFEFAVSAAYPVSDVLLLSMSWFAFTRSEARERRALLLLTAALAGIAVADSAFLYLTQTGGYSGAQLADLGWIHGFLLIVLAARGAAAPSGPAASAAAPLPRVALVAPYVPMLLGVGLSLGRVAHGGQLDLVMVVNASVVLVLLVAQQLLVIFENAAITHTLEQRVTARTAELGARERYFRVLVHGSSDVMIVLDRDLRVRDVSTSIERIFGYDPVTAPGRTLRWLFRNADVDPLVVAITRATSRPGLTVDCRWSFVDPDDRVRHVEATIANRLDEPAVAGIVLNCRDVTERVRLEDALRHQAFHDPLTQLANRALLRDRAQHAIDRDRREQHGIAVLVVDIDDFKTVNDSLGHAAGDELIAVMADRMRAAVRPGDTVARLGGDEFAVLLEDDVTPELAEAVGHRVIEVLREPVVVDGRELLVAASIGIAVREPGTTSVDELLRNADTAMYVAKATGKGRCVGFVGEMHDRAVERLTLRNELRAAIDRGELVLRYQPAIDLRTGALQGVEALVRWQHPTRGLLSPGAFITVAEETGLVVPLGRWVLHEACRQGARWNASLAPMSIAVNVSARQLETPGVVDDVGDALRSSGLEPDRLVLEVTESVLVSDPEHSVGVLHALKALGVRIAIDDFGTGYASLSYLQRLPVDVLKIDKSFVDNAHDGGQGTAFLAAILGLGKTLHLRTIAEGIEHRDQLQVLRRIGCDVGQGYLFSPPLDPATFESLVHARRDAHTPATAPATETATPV